MLLSFAMRLVTIASRAPRSRVRFARTAALHSKAPGEAREADLGIAAGKGKGVIFKRGEIVRHVLESEMVDALLEEVEKWEIEEAQSGNLIVEKGLGTNEKKFALPVIR